MAFGHSKKSADVSPFTVVLLGGVIAKAVKTDEVQTSLIQEQLDQNDGQSWLQQAAQSIREDI